MKKGVDFVGVTVSYLCFDRDGRLLLGKRGQNARDEHGRWDNGGGGQELGDSIETTLLKELQEEYCVVPIEYEFLGVHDVFREQNGVPTHWICIMYKVLVDPAQVRNGEPHKIDQIDWFTLDHLPHPLHSDLQNTLERYKAHLPG